MARTIIALLVVALFALSANAFLEDVYLPITDPPLPSTTQRPSTRPPPPDECHYFCQNLYSCKDIIGAYLKYSDSCDAQFNWNCFTRRYCFAQIGCPANHIKSGFGHSEEKQNRCLPVETCKYFAKIYVHLNDLHDDITCS